MQRRIKKLRLKRKIWEMVPVDRSVSALAIAKKLNCNRQIVISFLHTLEVQGFVKKNFLLGMGKVWRKSAIATFEDIVENLHKKVISQ